MLFKGNQRLSADDINRTFDELGADYNAFTSEERTVYYGAAPAGRTPELFDLLTELMEPSLRQADFDMEKNVILEEIAMYQDRPVQRLFEEASHRFWNGHPLGNSVLGSRDSITALSRDAMYDYFKQRYAPSNVLLVLAGNYDWDALLARAAQRTAGWSDYRVQRSRPEAHPSSGAQQVVDASLNRRHTALFAPGVGVDSDLRYAAAILASAIGDSSGSRLYWELVDKGVTDNAWLSHEASEGQGAFVGYLSAAPDRAAQVLDKYRAVLSQAQDEGLNEAEWRRAQRKIATGATFRAETPLGRLMSFGTGYQTLGVYQTVNQVVQQVMSTPLADGNRLLQGRPFDAPLILALGPE
jgi:predicted Zn-dependent peptidase